MKHSSRLGDASPAKRCAARAARGVAAFWLTHPLRSPCRTVVWNEQNLAHCEAGKDAKMKIDEPETPWASPPKELFSDDGACVRRSLPWSRRHTKQPPHAAPRAETGEPRGGGAARGGADMQRVAAQLAATSAGAAPGGEWDASDDEMMPAGEAATHQVLSRPRGGPSGAR